MKISISKLFELQDNVLKYHLNTTEFASRISFIENCFEILINIDDYFAFSDSERKTIWYKNFKKLFADTLTTHINSYRLYLIGTYSDASMLSRQAIEQLRLIDYLVTNKNLEELSDDFKNLFKKSKKTNKKLIGKLSELSHPGEKRVSFSRFKIDDKHYLLYAAGLIDNGEVNYWNQFVNNSLYFIRVITSLHKSYSKEILAPTTYQIIMDLEKAYLALAEK